MMRIRSCPTRKCRALLLESGHRLDGERSLQRPAQTQTAPCTAHCHFTMKGPSGSRLTSCASFVKRDNRFIWGNMRTCRQSP